MVQLASSRILDRKHRPQFVPLFMAQRDPSLAMAGFPAVKQPKSLVRQKKNESSQTSHSKVDKAAGLKCDISAGVLLVPRKTCDEAMARGSHSSAARPAHDRPLVYLLRYSRPRLVLSS